MFKKLSLLAFAASSLLLFGTAHAQTEDLIAGEITALNLVDGVGSLTIRQDDTDALRTFEVTEETEVTVKRATVDSLVPRPIEAEPSDLSVGDDVLLDVRTEVDGRETVVAYQRVVVEVPARNETAPAETVEPEPVIVAYQDTSDANETDYDYGSLPATATPLPLIALFAGAALLVAGGLRYSRRRAAK